jgi:prepilin-type N-terminal cleavage/methylation domain-containing protein
MFIKHKKGFSLVELLIVVAAMAGLALVGMQISKNQNQTFTKGNFDSDVLLTTNEINAILSDPVKCLATIGGMNALSTKKGINSINNGKFYSLESGSAPISGYGNSNLQIQNYALSATASDLASNNSYLLINYQNKNLLKTNSGSSLITKKINLYVEVNGSSNITKCRSLSSSSTDIWTRGMGSQIYYSGGNVGIGVKNPVGNLDVDNSSHDATICLNGSCAKSLGIITPTIYSKSATGTLHFAVSVSCGAGGVLLSGGCYDSGFRPDGGCSETALVVNYPQNATTWRCGSRDIQIPCTRTLTAYAICTK